MPEPRIKPSTAYLLSAIAVTLTMLPASPPLVEPFMVMTSLDAPEINVLPVDNENIEEFIGLIMNLGNESSAVLNVIHYFQDKVSSEANKNGTALDMKVVLKIIEQYSFHWKHENDGNKKNDLSLRQTEFEYEESENSIEFFLPFIWRLICNHSGILFLDHRIKIFKP